MKIFSLLVFARECVVGLILTYLGCARVIFYMLYIFCDCAVVHTFLSNIAVLDLNVIICDISFCEVINIIKRVRL